MTPIDGDLAPSMAEAIEDFGTEEEQRAWAAKVRREACFYRPRTYPTIHFDEDDL